eukprot:CAMPEP_0115072724 /NCGR_PEP_ID=MMETSP0227-20121206/14387_1 /TAXON_ID=89957 /ORGANISM="Polarella glacialis, Strain CCMP 1383" /LENGTH=694 /DNA_ID=CAMNT_0002459499 /DNA_START=14 /DNA_END=2098 /DNA_ORIENTATION=+
MMPNNHNSNVIGKAADANSVSSLEAGEPEALLPKEYREVYTGQPFKLSALFPPVTWLPAYIRSLRDKHTAADASAVGTLPFSLTGDVVAGLTVGFMLVPQCLAFALLAGLPVRVGLYSSFLPLIAYALFGSLRQVQVGPTALMSLLTGGALDAAGYIGEDRVAAASLLALLVAATNLLLGILRFGFVADFMSHSVMAAFVSASGIIIATSQLKTMLGIKIPRSEYWWETVHDLSQKVDKSDPPTFIMGFTLLFFLMSLKAWKTAGHEQKRSAHPVWRWFPRDKKSLPFRGLKLVADLSSVVSVILGWVWGLCYRAGGIDSVVLVGKTDTSGFEMKLPGGNLVQVDWSGLLASAIAICLIGFMETVAVGGKLAAQYRYKYDPNQELLSLGLANAASAVMSGFPVTGGFSRTAVNALFGATSQVAGGLTALVVLVAMYAIMPVVELLPQVALAPLIIQGALSVTSFHSFATAFRTQRSEFFVMLATFLMSMGLTVKEGLITGFVLSVIKLMFDVAVPNMVLCGQVKDGSFRDIRHYPDAVMPDQCVIVRIDARISFPNANRFQDFCLRAAMAKQSLELAKGSGQELKYVVMDFKSVNGIDITGIEMLEALAETLHQRGQSLMLANLKGPVARQLALGHVGVRLRELGGCLCWNMEQAMGIVNGSEELSRLEADEAVGDLLRRVRSPSTGQGMKRRK